MGYFMYQRHYRVPLSYNLTPFQVLRQNLSKNFVDILVQTMTPKRHFEINWPLEAYKGKKNPIKVTKIQIFKFRKIKGSYVWGNDECNSTLWKKATFRNPRGKTILWLVKWCHEQATCLMLELRTDFWKLLAYRISANSFRPWIVSSLE